MAVPLFSLGRVVATPAALSLLAGVGVSPAELLNRHQSGDWGEVPPEVYAVQPRPLRQLLVGLAEGRLTSVSIVGGARWTIGRDDFILRL